MARLSISNIAWEPSEDEEVARLLVAHDFHAVDIAPGKYFPEPGETSVADVLRVKNWWLDHGLQLTGMQSLLFGTTGLNLFGDDTARDRMIQHLRSVMHIGANLGATRLVFGSPKNRDRLGLSDSETLTQALSFFSLLGDAASDQGVVVCLEPNPVAYGANFMTTSIETEEVVQAVDHPCIQMQLDIGAVTMNDENVEDIIGRAQGIIGHIHASEPQLVPLGSGSSDHLRSAKAIESAFGTDQVVCVEMLSNLSLPVEARLLPSLRVAVRTYGTDQL